MTDLNIVGAGLAGSEAAWQAAELGLSVRLYEMRPVKETPAHRTQDFAELVCSNSLGGTALETASGLLKEELRRMGSVIIRCAEETSVPAGGALGVGREEFPRAVTEAVSAHPNIEIVREEVREIPSGPTVIASGPLTSDALHRHVERLSGQNLYFYDAASPIVHRDSLGNSERLAVELKGEVPVRIAPGEDVRYEVRAKDLAVAANDAGHSGTPKLSFVATDGDGIEHRHDFKLRVDEYLALKDE